MSEPFLGEIRLMSFNYAPREWAMCNGQLLPINQNQALFSLLGTTFGGDGRVNFALPDLRARVPIHVGSGHTLGERGGEMAHTLSLAEMPRHTHVLQASSSTGNAPVVTGNVYAANASALYHPPADLKAAGATSVTNVGGSQPHQNAQPFLAMTFCIALTGGIFPSPN
jgi:microcystin-dependent protein